MFYIQCQQRLYTCLYGGDAGIKRGFDVGIAAGEFRRVT